MSYTIIKPSNHDEWLLHRESGIGSSEVATILGLNPFDTPYKLWRRKVGLDKPIAENFAMRAGHYLEDAVSKFFEDETGKRIIKASAGDWLIANNDKPYLRVSPDRTYWIPNRKKTNKSKGIVECKTTQKTIESDDIPQHWFCQLQYQLGVAELEEGSIAWLTSGRAFGYKDFTFDKDFFDFIVEFVDKFWIDNVLGKKEPMLINAEDVLLKNPRHVPGKQVQADFELISQYNDLKEIKSKIAELTTQKTELEDNIKMMLGDAEILTFGKDSIATWKSGKTSKKFDEKRFAQENPELFNKYSYEAESTRRFVLK